MNYRTASWLAWSLAALSMVMFLASVAFFVLTRAAQAEAPSSLVTSRSIIDLLVSVPFLAFPLVGALIASRRPHNPIGWICLAVGLLWMLLGLFDYYGVYGLAKPDTVPFPVVIYALVEWLWLPTVGLLAIYLELAPIGWQLFILGSYQSDSTAFPLFLDTYATRLLARPLRCWRPYSTFPFPHLLPHTGTSVVR